jgi:ERCC4-related helicase
MMVVMRSLLKEKREKQITLAPISRPLMEQVKNLGKVWKAVADMLLKNLIFFLLKCNAFIRFVLF